MRIEALVVILGLNRLRIGGTSDFSREPRCVNKESLFDEFIDEVSQVPVDDGLS